LDCCLHLEGSEDFEAWRKDYEICKQVLKAGLFEILVNWETFPGISWDIEKPESLEFIKSCQCALMNARCMVGIPASMVNITELNPQP